MKVYISGKITGDDDYKEKFKKAEERLRSKGYAVMNPAILPDGFGYKEYMWICLAMLDVCDAIYMLNDWYDSRGAIEEYQNALSMGKIFMFDKETDIEETLTLIKKPV